MIFWFPELEFLPDANQLRISEVRLESGNLFSEGLVTDHILFSLCQLFEIFDMGFDRPFSLHAFQPGDENSSVSNIDSIVCSWLNHCWSRSIHGLLLIADRSAVLSLLLWASPMTALFCLLSLNIINNKLYSMLPYSTNMTRNTACISTILL